MKKKRKKPRPVEKPDGRTTLERTADLTRRIVQVPKADLPKDARKQPEPKHG